MAKRTRKDVLSIVSNKMRLEKASHVYPIVEELMDILREMDAKDLQRKIRAILRHAPKRAITKPFKASLKKVRRVLPKGDSLKPKIPELENSAELNALMKEALRHREEYKKMSLKEIADLTKKLDEKIELPDVSSGQFLKIRNPKTKIYKDGNDIYHEVEIADSLGVRQGGEKQFLESKGKFKRPEVKGMERAHSVGPGLGLDLSLIHISEPTRL